MATTMVKPKPKKATLVFELKRMTLNNVDDIAGRWQYEGGEVLVGTNRVAHYASTKRVIFKATDAQNTAMLTLSIFFLGFNPPENITLQGSHDFNSGGEVGSVTAASSAYAMHIGKQFTLIGESLHIL